MLWGVDWIAVEAIATAVTAVILAVTLVFAAAQVRQARKLREEQSRPYVVVDIEPSAARPYADLFLTNLGATAAYRVTLEFTPPVQTTQEQRGYVLRDSNLLQRGVPTLPPHREMRALFDHVPDRVKAGLPSAYQVTIRYQDRRGKKFADEYAADLSPVIGVQTIARKDAHEMATAAERIAKTLESWTVSDRGVRVFNKSWDRYSWENGHLLRHPRLAGRWWLAVVERTTGVELGSPFDDRERGWRFWTARLLERARAGWRAGS